MAKVLFFCSVSLPLLIAALGIPLLRGAVAPNRLYGFRTAKSLSSPELWYAFNRLAGWSLVGAGLFAAVITCVVWKFWNFEPAGKLALSGLVLAVSMSAVVLIPLLLGPKG